MLTTPVGDLVIIVAAGDAGASDQEQHLRQGVLHLNGLTRITNLAKMIKQKAPAVLGEDLSLAVRLPWMNPTHLNQPPDRCATKFSPLPR